MDGSIVTTVEFAEVKKGYDPEQVDNYLAELGDKLTLLATNLRAAVDTAEAAEARAVAALKERDAALARAEEAEARAPEGDDGAEALRKMLMLAQRTADTAVEEAQASAKNIVADGRSKAAEIVADAEKRAERLLVEAQKVCDEMMQEKSAEIVATVTELEARRDALLADTTALSRHLHDHRLKLQETLAGLRKLVDTTGGLDVGPLPVLETDVPPARPGASGGGPEVEDAATSPASAATQGDRPLTSEDTPRPDLPPPPGAGSGPASGTSVGSGAGTAARAGRAEPAPRIDVGPASSGSPAAGALADQPAGAPENPSASVLVQELGRPADGDPAEGADAGPGAETVRITAEEVARPSRPALFDVELDDDTGLGGPPTRELTVDGADAALGDDPLLGAADAEADEAMRRFFEDELPADRKRRFRRS